jgi:hypothetical protein
MKRRSKAKVARELRVAELRRLAELRSLKHTDADSFDRDHRVGAVLINPRSGAVLARRIAPPSRTEWRSMGARSLTPEELPAGHPRVSEDRDRSESALRLDRAQLSGWPWL